MKKYYIYIIGCLCLLVGLVIGFAIKSNSEISHNHATKEVNSDNSNQSETTEIWTCSMHPQIRQNEPGICPICAMDLIPLDSSMGTDDPTVLQMSNEAVKLAQIETFTIPDNGENEDSSSNLSVIKVDGTVELDERTVKSQTAHLQGRIDQMTVTYEGQYVTRGQKIASIFSTELMAASEELITASQFKNRVEGIEEAAIQKLKNWKISDEDIQKILTLKKPMGTIDIYADHSGFVLNTKLSQGDYVKQGDVLYTICSTDKVWLIFNVFESDLTHIKKGNTVTFTTPSSQNIEYSAKINFIDPLLNNEARTAKLRAEFSNSKLELKPGMFLNGHITPERETASKNYNSQIQIPNSAILWTGEKSVVYVQNTENEVPTFQFREVNIGTRSKNFTTIISGLDYGEKIVTQGAFAIDAAAQLNNTMSMMNRQVEIKSTDDVAPTFVNETPSQFKVQLDNAVLLYIELKNALVNANPSEATIFADNILNEVENIDANLLKGKAQEFWLSQLQEIKTYSEKINKSVDVEDQRKQFEFLSIAIINSLKAFGTDHKTYFVQYCPMVNNNKGADWISVESEIKNPYFGSKMMKCGSVKLELN